MSVAPFFFALSQTTPYEIKPFFVYFSLIFILPGAFVLEINFLLQFFSISSCPANYTCLANVGPNPNDGYTSFDNIGWALLMAFQILTMDYWENLYNKVTKEVLPILSMINPFENFRLLSCEYERLCETRNQMETTLICMKEKTRFHIFDRKTFFET